MTGAYNASKFAIEAIADAWRLELRPWGIEVVLVEPAMTDTDLWRKAPETLEAEAAEMSAEHRDLYAEHLDGMRKTDPADPEDGETGRRRGGDDRAGPHRHTAPGPLRGRRRRQGPGGSQRDHSDRLKDRLFGLATGTPAKP